MDESTKTNWKCDWTMPGEDAHEYWKEYGSLGWEQPPKLDAMTGLQVGGFGAAGRRGVGDARVGRGQHPDRPVGAGEARLGIADGEGDAGAFALLALDVDGHDEGGDGLFAGVLHADLHQGGLADHLVGREARRRPAAGARA